MDAACGRSNLEPLEPNGFDLKIDFFFKYQVKNQSAQWSNCSAHDTHPSVLVESLNLRVKTNSTAGVHMASSNSTMAT